MKPYLLFFLAVLAACSSPQGPAGKLQSGIPNLKVNDTLDFNSISWNTSEQMTLEVQNTSSDTIQLSQSFSKSFFMIVNDSQTKLIIAPGEAIGVAIKFSQTDTLPHEGFDTLRSGGITQIVVFRSYWKSAGTPNLKAQDTLFFPSVPLNASEQETLELENEGTDTIRVTQSLSADNFSLINFSQSNITIPPGQKADVGISFIERDTFPHSVFDTLEINGFKRIELLQSSWQPFSTMYPLGPQSISISLSGLIGKDARLGTTHDFSFDLSSGNLSQWGNVLVFQSSYNWSDSHGESESDATTIRIQLDTIGHIITEFNGAFSQYIAHNYAPHGWFQKNVSLVGHNIPLVLEGNTWVANAKGLALTAVIDTAIYYASPSGPFPPSSEEADLQSINGFENTAVLTLAIQ